MKNRKLHCLSTLFAIVSMTASLSVFAQQPDTIEAHSYEQSCPTEAGVTVHQTSSEQTSLEQAPLSYVVIPKSNRANSEIYMCYYSKPGSFIGVIPVNIGPNKKIAGFASEKFSKSDKCEASVSEPCKVRIVHSLASPRSPTAR